MTKFVPLLAIMALLVGLVSVAHAQGTPPTVQTVAITSNPGTESTYAKGDTITVTLTFSEAVTVDTTNGTPYVVLDIGEQPRNAAYSGDGSSAAAQPFSYTALAGDHDADGVSLKANSLALNGGAIRATDDSTAATLTHSAMTFTNHIVDTSIVLVSNLARRGLSESALGANGDLAQSFTTGAASYPLTSIELRYVTASSTNAPTVTLHSGSATGTKVADFTGPSALTARATRNYAYTPTTSVTLAASTEYWAVAQGGSSTVKWQYTESDGEDAGHADGWSIADKGGSRRATSTGAFNDFSYAFKLRVHGYVAPTPATGAPAITAPNVFRVPAALGVDLTGIIDANGASGIADTATYRWQRFAADGVTLEADGIGTGSTYTLTDADAGKRLKVAVSFTDDAGSSEGPLTSAAALITAAADCNAPTYVGGATQVWTGKLGVEKVDEGGGLVNYGYLNAAQYVSSGSVFGTLDNPSFTADADHTIDYLYMIKGGNTVGVLSMTLRGTNRLTAAERGQLALHVCDTPLTLSSADHAGVPERQLYVWDQTSTGRAMLSARSTSAATRSLLRSQKSR